MSFMAEEDLPGKGFLLRPIGFVRSALKSRAECPKQGHEGAPDAWIDMDMAYAPALEGLSPGQEVLVLTWFHEGRRDLTRVHPGNNPNAPLRGVFSTRSPDRPNPIGLHRVEILEIIIMEKIKVKMHVRPLEALDGTPVIDIKPLLSPSKEA